jgi:hypothetical protein
MAASIRGSYVYSLQPLVRGENVVSDLIPRRFYFPGTGVSARFFHTEDQSVGHIVMILISRGPVSILLM